METEKKIDVNENKDTLSYEQLEIRIKNIVETIICIEDIKLKKRNLNKLLNFIKTLINYGSISPLCISSISENLLQNEDIHIILLEIFINAADKGEIRRYIMLIEEFRIYFPNVDFIYNSAEIQDAITKDIDLLKLNGQSNSVLNKYLKK